MIKICGLRRWEDAECAVQAGATAVGFIFWPRSPRYVSPDEAAAIVKVLPPEIMTVGVFVDEAPSVMQGIAEATGLRALQLHGSEPASHAAVLTGLVIKALGASGVDAAHEWPASTLILLDAVDTPSRGGTGARVDWGLAEVAARTRRVVLAGGLTPENVDEAITTVRPFGVDVSSGVEVTPGVKDPEKIRRFVTNARQAFARLAVVEQGGGT
jgi:phosphoribosylanthranilate isomerase